MALFGPPFGHPPFGTPWGPWRGWGHMGTLKAYIGPCRPPYGPLRALIGGPQEGSWTMYGVSNTPILWSLKWTRPI